MNDQNQAPPRIIPQVPTQSYIPWPVSGYIPTVYPPNYIPAPYQGYMQSNMQSNVQSYPQPYNQPYQQLAPQSQQPYENLHKTASSQSTRISTTQSQPSMRSIQPVQSVKSMRSVHSVQSQAESLPKIRPPHKKTSSNEDDSPRSVHSNHSVKSVKTVHNPPSTASNVQPLVSNPPSTASIVQPLVSNSQPSISQSLKTISNSQSTISNSQPLASNVQPPLSKNSTEPTKIQNLTVKKSPENLCKEWCEQAISFPIKQWRATPSTWTFLPLKQPKFETGEDYVWIHPCCYSSRVWKESVEPQTFVMANSQEYNVGKQLQFLDPHKEYDKFLQCVHYLNRISKYFLYIPMHDLITKNPKPTISTFERLFPCIQIVRVIRANDPSYIFKVRIVKPNDPNSYECVMKIVNNDKHLNSKQSFVKFSMDKTILPSAWAESLHWAVIQPKCYYGHFNFVDPISGQHFTALFIPYFHSTLYELVTNQLKYHTEHGYEKVEDEKKKIHYYQSTWPPIFLAHMAQILFRLMIPIKEKFFLCHNDLKIDNMAYIKTDSNRFMRIGIRIPQVMLPWFFDESKPLPDYTHLQVDKSVVVYLNIPFYQREFFMIDFGWSCMTLPVMDVIHLKQIGDANSYTTYASDSPFNFEPEYSMITTNLMTDIGQMCSSFMRSFSESPLQTEKLLPEWKEFYQAMYKASMLDQGIHLDYIKWEMPMYDHLSKGYHAKHIYALLRLIIQYFADKEKIHSPELWIDMNIFKN